MRSRGRHPSRRRGRRGVVRGGRGSQVPPPADRAALPCIRSRFRLPPRPRGGRRATIRLLASCPRAHRTATVLPYGQVGCGAGCPVNLCETNGSRMRNHAYLVSTTACATALAARTNYHPGGTVGSRRSWMFQNADEAKKFIADEDVKFVDVRFCDL